MDEALLRKLTKNVAKDILLKLNANGFYALIADGTGFGYSDAFYLTYKRGQQLRKVKSHVKTEILAGIIKGKTIVLNINASLAYTDEGKLLKPMLEEFCEKCKYFAADRYYGTAEILKIKEKGMLALIPLRDTIHQKVRNTYRVWAKKNYEKFKENYKKIRYRIEQIIGIVKNIFGDRDRTFLFKMAKLRVYARFALYNLIELFQIIFYLILHKTIYYSNVFSL